MAEPQDPAELALGTKAATPPAAPLPPAAALGARQPMPKRGPALVVIGIVALISLGGAAMALAGTGGHHNPVKRSGRLSAGAIRAEPANALLAPIIRGGEPPSDVRSHLVVPEHSVRTSVQCAASVIDLYDCALHLRAPDSPPAVISFFEHELVGLGWSKLSVTSTDHGLGTEVLDQIASSDGYYWEVGVFVDPERSSTPGLSGPASVVEVRVLERDDGD